MLKLHCLENESNAILFWLVYFISSVFSILYIFKKNRAAAIPNEAAYSETSQVLPLYLKM